MGYDVYETQFGYEGDRDYLIVYPGANPNVYATDLEDKDFWEEVKKTLTLVESFDKKSLKESKDIDALLDAAGGTDEVEQRIIDTLRNYPNADADELAEMLEDDNLSFDEWMSIIEYLDIDF